MTGKRRNKSPITARGWGKRVTLLEEELQEYILEDICPYICPGETGRYGEREIMGMKYTRILVKELVEEINEVSR